MTIKLFSSYDERNKEKKKIEQSKNKPQEHIWEIRFFKVWVNIGQEISKWKPFMRPGILLNNIPKSDLVVIAPLTTKIATNKNVLVLDEWHQYWLHQASAICLNHIKSVSKKRLIYKVIGVRKKWKRIKLIPLKVILQIISEFQNTILKLK